MNSGVQLGARQFRKGVETPVYIERQWNSAIPRTPDRLNCNATLSHICMGAVILKFELIQLVEFGCF